MIEFISIDFLTERTFKDPQDNDVKRIYRFGIPYGAPYEEIRSVAEEFLTRLGELETQGKEREAEKAAQEAESSSSEDVVAEIVK